MHVCRIFNRQMISIHNPIEKKVFILKHVISLKKWLILAEDNGSRIDLERVKDLTNIVDEVKELKSDSTPAEGHTICSVL